MSTCELFEVEVSALLDGELAAPSVPAVLDHLLACPTCRDFYHGSRALERAIHGEPESRPAPAADWPAIARGAGLDRRRPALPRWAALAAGVVLAVAGASTLGVVALRRPPQTLEVRLESGRMSDQRFVELAAELLRSDRTYHRKMAEVLAVVNAGSFRQEGSAEPGVPAEEVVPALQRGEDHEPERRARY